MITEIALFQIQFPVLTATLVFITGCMLGTYINLLVYNLYNTLVKDWESEEWDDEEFEASFYSPLGLLERFSLMLPQFRCPFCRTRFKPWRLIPLVNYFLAWNVCICRQPQTRARYPRVEIATGLLTVLVILQLGLTPEGLAGCILTWALVALTLMDSYYRVLPDVITQPMIWLGLLVNLPRIITTLEAAVAGALLGYLLLWCVNRLFRLVTGKEGMGHGDFKLLALLGAWLGWQALAPILLISSLLGASYGGILLLKGHDKSKPIPFGPCLAIAGWLMFLWGEELTLAWRLL